METECLPAQNEESSPTPQRPEGYPGRPGVIRRASVLACSCTSEDACATEKPADRQDIMPLISRSDSEDHFDRLLRLLELEARAEERQALERVQRLPAA